MRVGPSACQDGDSPSGSSQPLSPDDRCEAAVQVNTGSARALSPACTCLELSWPQVAGPGGEPVGPATAKLRVCIDRLTFLLDACPPGNLPPPRKGPCGARLTWAGPGSRGRGQAHVGGARLAWAGQAHVGGARLAWAGPTPSPSRPSLPKFSCYKGGGWLQTPTRFPQCLEAGGGLL